MRKGSILFKSIVMLFLFFVSGFSETIHLSYKPEKLTEKVFILGDFTEWEKVPMRFDSAEQKFVYDINLPPGIYEYRFFSNGQYFRDPDNPLFGGSRSNSLVYIPGTEPVIKSISPKRGETITDSVFTLNCELNTTVPVDTAKSYAIINSDTFKSVIVNKKNIAFKIRVHRNSLAKVSLHIFNVKGEKAFVQPFAYRIKIKESIPRAEAGFLYKALTSQSVQLSGLHSYDPDYDMITRYEWEIIAPSEDIELLTADTLPEIKVVCHREGIYKIRLKVSDGAHWSDWDTTYVWAIRDYRVPVVFRYNSEDLGTDSIKSISLVGEFNHWKANQDTFIYENKIWKLRKKFYPGIYEYKIVLNNTQWIPDPENSRQIDDGWNGKNSLLNVEPPDDYEFPIFSWEAPFLELHFQESSKLSDFKVHWIIDPNSGHDINVVQEGDKIKIIPLKRWGSVLFYLQLVSEKAYSQVYTFLARIENHRIRLYTLDQAPEWVEKSILYEIFVPAFGKAYNSGNLKSILEKFPYFHSLGVNSLWLTPVLHSPSEHNYNPVSYFNIDPDIGDMELYQKIIEKAHTEDIKIFFDFIGNHSGDQHPFFISAWNNPFSYFRNFYRFHGKFQYEYHNDWDQLPNLNYENNVVRQFMTEVATFWVQKGVDAFRCDAAWGVPHSYWKYLRKELKSINPDLVLLDEVLPRDPEFHCDEFDMSYNTDLYGNILDFLRGKKSHPALWLNFKKDIRNYPPGAAFLNYLENHDMPRFIKEFGPDKFAVFTSLILLSPGTPMIYYGQENGLLEQRELFYPENIQDIKYFQFISQLIQIRKRILVQGKLNLVDHNNLLIFANRGYEILMNLDQKPVKLQTDIFKKYKLLYKINSTTVKILDSTRIISEINPFEILILEIKNR